MSSLPRGPERRCTACGAVVTDPTVFTCPDRRAGDDIDHLLGTPEPDGPWPTADVRDSPGTYELNPFVEYRRLAWSWTLARAGGLTDDQYVGMVRALDEQVAAVGGSGHGFEATPLRPLPDLGRALGLPGTTTLLAKDETGNVSGSHKARHLMGLMIHLAVLENLHLLDGRPRLAIASCGNAALGAAVVAAAADWPLDVFVPPEANTVVLDRLRALQAAVHLCPRQPGEVGDPCYLRFRQAVDRGAIPFATQGPENGVTIDGGATLGYELADQLARAGIRSPDRLYVQVGGGALAASVLTGLQRAVDGGRLGQLPRLMAVQTKGAAPLVRAYDRVVERLARADGASGTSSAGGSGAGGSGAGPSGTGCGGTHSELLRDLARRRSEVMWPWESEPRSLAAGILDDETYDWRAVVDGLLRTGGRAMAVDEDDVATAHRLVHQHTTVDADPTGTAGGAGLRADARAGDVRAGEVVIVLLTGVTRR